MFSEFILFSFFSLLFVKICNNFIDFTSHLIYSTDGFIHFHPRKLYIWPLKTKWVKKKQNKTDNILTLVTLLWCFFFKFYYFKHFCQNDLPFLLLSWTKDSAASLLVWRRKPYYDFCMWNENSIQKLKTTSRKLTISIYSIYNALNCYYSISLPSSI